MATNYSGDLERAVRNARMARSGAGAPGTPMGDPNDPRQGSPASGLLPGLMALLSLIAGKGRGLGGIAGGVGNVVGKAGPWALGAGLLADPISRMLAGPGEGEAPTPSPTGTPTPMPQGPGAGAQGATPHTPPADSGAIRSRLQEAVSEGITDPAQAYLRVFGSPMPQNEEGQAWTQLFNSAYTDNAAWAVNPKMQAFLGMHQPTGTPGPGGLGPPPETPMPAPPAGTPGPGGGPLAGLPFPPPGPPGAPPGLPAGPAMGASSPQAGLREGGPRPGAPAAQGLTPNQLNYQFDPLAMSRAVQNAMQGLGLQAYGNPAGVHQREFLERAVPGQALATPGGFSPEGLRGIASGLAQTGLPGLPAATQRSNVSGLEQRMLDALRANPGQDASQALGEFSPDEAQRMAYLMQAQDNPELAGSLWASSMAGGPGGGASPGVMALTAQLLGILGQKYTNVAQPSDRQGLYGYINSLFKQG